MAVVSDPKSVKVNLSTGTGLDIEWKDGHQSHYSFPFLRDACPCALCDETRGKTHLQPGEPAKPAPGTLPMFKPTVKATSAEGVGKYAIKFQFNDGHELGITRGSSCVSGAHAMSARRRGPAMLVHITRKCG